MVFNGSPIIAAVFVIKIGNNTMNNFFEFLGFQDAMKQSESQQSMSDIANDLIMNGNYTNTVDLVSDMLDLQLNKDKY